MAQRNQPGWRVLWGAALVFCAIGAAAQRQQELQGKDPPSNVIWLESLDLRAGLALVHAAGPHQEGRRLEGGAVHVNQLSCQLIDLFGGQFCPARALPASGFGHARWIAPGIGGFSIMSRPYT